MERPAEFDRKLDAHYRDNFQYGGMEDIYQEAYIRAMEYWESYDPSHSFDSWMGTIISNRLKQKAVGDIREEEMMCKFFETEKIDKALSLDKESLDRKALIIMEMLKDKRLAQISRAYLLYGYNQEQIGKELGVSKMQISRLLRKASEAMEEAYDKGSDSRYRK